MKRALLVVAVLALSAASSDAETSQPGSVPDPALTSFRRWLDASRPGYGCDEGPAPFRNKTVEAAYPGQRFYYVLTYTRGTPPPFRNGLSVVAHVDHNGKVAPLDQSALTTYRQGLRKVSTAKQARASAAAVMILAMGDPGERRWKFRESMFTAKKDKTGWVCTYRHGNPNYTSQVVFDGDGVLSAISANPPPVP